MKKALFIVIYILANFNCSAQSGVNHMSVSLTDAQVTALASAIDYYKANYSQKLYGLYIEDDESNIELYFDSLPTKHPPSLSMGGGAKVTKITYSKKLLKITNSIQFYQR